MNQPRLVDATTWKSTEAASRADLGVFKATVDTPERVTSYRPEGEKADEVAVERALWWTVSTEQRDRDKDRLSIGGWDTKNYRKNPVVLWAHNSGSGMFSGPPIPPIGRALKIEIDREKGRLRLLKQFAPQEVHPFGFMIYQLALEGILKAASVGFLPTKWQQDEPQEGEKAEERIGLLFLKQELLESSVVSIPSNPGALQEAKSVKGIDLAPYLPFCEQVLDEKSTGLWLPKKDVEAVYAIVRPQTTIITPAERTFVEPVTAAPSTETEPVTQDPAPEVRTAPSASDGIPETIIERAAPVEPVVIVSPAVATAPAVVAVKTPDDRYNPGDGTVPRTKAIDSVESARVAMRAVADWLFDGPTLSEGDRVRMMAALGELTTACEHACTEEDDAPEAPSPTVEAQAPITDPIPTPVVTPSDDATRAAPTSTTPPPVTLDADAFRRAINAALGAPS